MNACWEAAELETDVAAAKTTCGTKETKIYALVESTGKAFSDIKDGDIEQIEEDAVQQSIIEIHKAILVSDHGLKRRCVVLRCKEPGEGGQC